MLINERPRLACSTFLHTLKGSTITLEPLSKFPLVRDLIVDRSILFENLKKLNLWLESEAYMNPWTHEPRYQSARCLMCGCCLEVCPNFSAMGLSQALLLQSTHFGFWMKNRKALIWMRFLLNIRRNILRDAGSRYLVMIFVRLVCLWKNCL